MKVNLLLNRANRAWIIQKIAENLARHLEQLQVAAFISEHVDESADIVHHMSWAFANAPTRQPSTMLITHLDDVYKLNEVRRTLRTFVKVGVCMSNDTMGQLLRHGCDPLSLYVINPAHDGLIAPRRVVIGITSRVYPDGRKRESVLQDVARRMSLAAFEFRIFGEGWEPTIAHLQAAGAQVEYFRETGDYREDYRLLQAAIPQFDYYLYLGVDEGSLGTLDALAAGVATIITPQGFHLDLPGGVTHPVLSAEDLQQVLTDIAGQRMARRASVEGLTWAGYAERHRDLWGAMLKNAPLPELPKFNPPASTSGAALEAMRRRSLYVNALYPRRLLSAISHLPFLASLRQAMDRKRLRSR